ncbi:hypothetical protein [Mycolicibacterium austroafricanum]|uniref:hypothetical protein n=1 Tax=Mycolicibacterium austroafricanum TaxID=39687 RepID=UPI001CA3346B|nr:hypothetical protein [Mycolicibacterium austroafricanum]QZT56759.1 hypothetical protein JN084_28350 [Mycolicibacterium austroafricanum]
MTENTDPAADFDDDVRIYWNQLRAVDLCRAISRSDNSAADALIAEVAKDDEPIHLIAGLAWAAGSLAKTVAAQHPTATENSVWEALTERSATGLHATREIRQMLDTTTTEGETNA